LKISSTMPNQTTASALETCVKKKFLTRGGWQSAAATGMMAVQKEAT
jgi:hypothetical protein